MVQTLAIMIVIFVLLSVVYVVKINIMALRLTKEKEINNKINPLEKDYQFIKGLY
ncbi:hypothetical protein [Flavobacterium sp. '19STA2R22 D10 B1']|uniref:hypothetical protein n=1 Tax=Flavobacterium aerium TaxID=3037261 RepID=UPI00278C505D|nr:hypothetical protein [Flavobacterium sp. '19STA2R22 D10 B1']